MSKKKICGVVVLYYPDDSLKDNIATYKNKLDKIYLIDNSEEPCMNVQYDFAGESKYEYHAFSENRGLAYALKFAFDLALKEKYDYALTMDQDSRFRYNDLEKIIRFMEKNDRFAIVAPNVCSVQNIDGKEVEFYYLRERNTIEKWVMTSGSLIKLEDYNLTNGFDDKLFIQHIDIDYCYQLYLLGKKIYLIEDAIIYQHFGNSRPRKILWKTVYPSFAKPIRTYYLFRNQKYLEKKYGLGFKKFSGVHLWKFILKIILFENNKREKIKMAIKGIIDGTKGIFTQVSNTCI